MKKLQLFLNILKNQNFTYSSGRIHLLFIRHNKIYLKALQQTECFYGVPLEPKESQFYLQILEENQFKTWISVFIALTKQYLLKKSITNNSNLRLCSLKLMCNKPSVSNLTLIVLHLI